MLSFSWEDVVRLIKENRMEELVRSPKGNEEYDMMMNKIREKYQTVGDFIISREFNFESVVSPTTGKLITPIPKDVKQVSWKVNDYRYDTLEDDIEHHLIWSTYELSEEEVELISKTNRKGYHYISFITDPPMKSVPNVHHVHIFSIKQQ